MTNEHLRLKILTGTAESLNITMVYENFLNYFYARGRTTVDLATFLKTKYNARTSWVDDTWHECLIFDTEADKLEFQLMFG